MARPIEATPVLKGRAAEKFVQMAQNPKPYVSPVFDLEKMNKAIKQIAEHSAAK